MQRFRLDVTEKQVGVFGYNSVLLCGFLSCLISCAVPFFREEDEGRAFLQRLLPSHKTYRVISNRNAILIITRGDLKFDKVQLP
jgi:hypothetical protein